MYRIKNQQRKLAFEIIAKGDSVAVLSSNIKFVDRFLENFMELRRDPADWCYSRANTEVCIFHHGDAGSRREIIMAIKNLAPRFNCIIIQLGKN